MQTQAAEHFCAGVTIAPSEGLLVQRFQRLQLGSMATDGRPTLRRRAKGEKQHLQNVMELLALASGLLAAPATSGYPPEATREEHEARPGTSFTATRFNTPES